MSRVLVVANETVEAEELLAELRRIEDEHSSTFLVVAPAVAAEHGLGTWSRRAPSRRPRSGSTARSRCCGARASSATATSATWCRSRPCAMRSTASTRP